MKPLALPASLLTVCLLAASAPGARADVAARDYGFDGGISREVLENYLSRSITMMDLLSGVGDPDDNIRMLKDIGVKFAGRTLYVWGGEARVPGLLPGARELAERIHAVDPEMVLQCGIFEIVTTEVGRLEVPERVLKEFEQPLATRRFRYEDMLYRDGHRKDQWRRGSSVPDMSRLETRLWFYHLATSYIDAGCEAIHIGQVEIMDDADPGHRSWYELLERVRRYASQHARRHWVIVDAHVPSGGIVRDGKLLFDFHSFPLRIDEVVERPHEGVLKMGYLDSIFGRSKGGITPSGWKCESLPFLVELDNFGRSRRGGQNIGAHWIWGWDEICWFAHQPKAYRDAWLRYAWDWVREHDPNGWLQMPGSRILASPVDGKRWYFANRPSAKVPGGFGQEDVIREIWAADGERPATEPAGRGTTGDRPR